TGRRTCRRSWDAIAFLSAIQGWLLMRTGRACPAREPERARFPAPFRRTVEVRLAGTRQDVGCRTALVERVLTDSALDAVRGSALADHVHVLDALVIGSLQDRRRQVRVRVVVGVVRLDTGNGRVNAG